jgi:hypothetical protein
MLLLSCRRYINHIRFCILHPEEFDKLICNLNNNRISVNPECLNTDEALYLVRSFHTSEIRDSQYDDATGKLSINMSGNTGVPTSCFVYMEEDGKIVERQVEIPSFENEIAVEIALK